MLQNVFLFVHIICKVSETGADLSGPVRKVLYSFLQRQVPGRGINMLALNGTHDHIHFLVQLHSSQNLQKLVNDCKQLSAEFVNDSKLLSQPFSWEEGFAAYSVSPSSVKQVKDYIYKQEEYHTSRTFEQEMEVFEKLKIES